VFILGSAVPAGAVTHQPWLAMGTTLVRTPTSARGHHPVHGVHRHRAHLPHHVGFLERSGALT
jgi:hypothetical protein